MEIAAKCAIGARRILDSHPLATTAAGSLSPISTTSPALPDPVLTLGLVAASGGGASTSPSTTTSLGRMQLSSLSVVSCGYTGLEVRPIVDVGEWVGRTTAASSFPTKPVKLSVAEVKRLPKQERAKYKARHTAYADEVKLLEEKKSVDDATATAAREQHSLTPTAGGVPPSDSLAGLSSLTLAASLPVAPSGVAGDVVT